MKYKDSYLAAAKILADGGLAVIPTDTVYGIAVRADNEKAVSRLYRLKGREGKPGTLIAASAEELIKIGLKRKDIIASSRFWPGSVSVVIELGKKMEYLHQGMASLAVRVPSDKPLLDLLSETGPLMTSSANPPGGKPAKNIDIAHSYFGSQVDYYLDGGELNSKPSTILRIVDDKPIIIRQGAIIIDL